jgi:hypothetical protein
MDKLILLILMLFVAAPVSGQSPPQALNQKRNAPNNEAKHPVAVTHHPTTDDTAKKDDNYENVSIRNPVTVVRDWVLIGVTIAFDFFVLLFNALLWRTTRRQWLVARANLEIAQRAYVTVHDVKVVQPIFMGGQPSVSVEYRNSGKTPAYMTIATNTGFKRSFLEGVPTSVFDSEDFMLDQTMLLGPDVSRSEFVAEGTYLDPLPPADQELIDNVRQRNLYWRTWIKIRYRDVFEDTHGSVEVWVYNPERDKFEPLTLGSKMDTKKGERQEDMTKWIKFMSGLSCGRDGVWLFLRRWAK